MTYQKDKSTRITLRLNERQFEFVRENAEILGVSPSEFLRMVVNSTMSMSQKAVDNVKKKIVAEVGAEGRENDKADKHYLV